ncbi:TetR family transcriptional regulator [Caldimonas mangrovi]|nr:TetR family transcriptional regulator [Caldimonas mangrovi]
MVRRTKEEAEQTRRSILAAARKTFHEQGVGNTSLEQIAHAAGLTRGAIYWHFANKEELFKAMRQEVTVPLADRMDYTLLSDPATAPLDRIRNFLMQFSDSVSDDPSVRHTMEILNFKCEFVGEMQQDLADYVVHSEECLSKLQRTYQAAQRNGDLRTGISPKMAAMETLVFLTGLLRLRLLGVPALQTRRELNALIAAHVDSRRQAG